MGDPQSLNLYAYVGNNPIIHVDADGHSAGWDRLINSAITAAEALLNKIGMPKPDAGKAQTTGPGATHSGPVQSQSTPPAPGQTQQPSQPPAPGQTQQPSQSQAPNNGTPRPGIMNPFVAQQNAQFNECVKSGTLVITRLAEVNGFLNPDDYTNDSKQAANSRDLQVDCLKQNPLAALSPNYSGMYGPASPAVVGIFSSNWF
jgi:hypothetical protein